MTALDLFDQINSAVLDLQGATLQTYGRSLRRLGQLLNHPDLFQINEGLTAGLNLEQFIEDGRKTGGSLVGSSVLQWPDDPKKQLGMQLLLVKHLAEDPQRAINLSHDFYYSGKKVISGIQTMTGQLIIPFVRDFKAYVRANGSTTVQLLAPPKSNKVFIVHGHDVAARESVARFLEKIGIDVVILHEQANQGRTIIEKIVANSDVGFAVVLLTPDDEGRSVGGDSLEPRARQNVLLELGYFIAKLGRGNVCALKKGRLEIPSDFAGVVWSVMDDNNGWKTELAKELKAADYPIDWNKVMG
ncbi:putative nucleotide-binding protein with TIR-like domain [Plasticicumulans lactativorans]|uniref:Putative nucleotide-binding protein with TIR-like domain n=1 Tax=Plasticicumulans lactativorans TaxID=1133106 RepID=A0A4R2L7Z1_9GAMM|nr:nucleotide-binding protein [Plasticicumulans lactativorans]TCO82776.1 putative nucleotide-binding protein with TIR-like domain [Plasticicumulans lactativorans]